MSQLKTIAETKSEQVIGVRSNEAVREMNQGNGSYRHFWTDRS